MTTSLIVDIDALGEKGEGLGRLPDGGRLIVPGALPGEKVRIAIGEQRREGTYGRVLEILSAVMSRAAPPCRYYGACGGCGLQHLAEADYAAWKRERVLQALTRCGLVAEKVEGPLVSPPGSRRRAVLSAKCDQTATVHLGFNERRSHALVAIESCTVLRPALVDRLPTVRALLARIMLPGESYDIALAEVEGHIDLLITVLGKTPRPCPDVLKKSAAADQGHGFARIAWQPNRSKPPEIIFDTGEFRAVFGEVPVSLPPGGFMQATAEGEAALTGFALEGLSKKKACVADLFAGSGTFSLAFLVQGCWVEAFEGDAGAAEALEAAGAFSGRLKAVRRDLFRDPLGFQELQNYDAVVIDPPRLGAEAQMREIAKSRVGRVISISCNPDTFARDGAILVQKGFRLDRLRIVDQFLWSPHVEVAGLFIRD